MVLLVAIVLIQIKEQLEILMKTEYQLFLMFKNLKIENMKIGLNVHFLEYMMAMGANNVLIL